MASLACLVRCTLVTGPGFCVHFGRRVGMLTQIEVIVRCSMANDCAGMPRGMGHWVKLDVADATKTSMSTILMIRATIVLQDPISVGYPKNHQFATQNSVGAT